MSEEPIYEIDAKTLTDVIMMAKKRSKPALAHSVSQGES